MAPPERERGRPLGTALADQAAAKQTDRKAKGTPALARLTWNGHPGLLSTYARRRGWLDPDLARLLRDHEAAALAIFDAIGPRRSRDVARRLHELAEEVVA